MQQEQNRLALRRQQIENEIAQGKALQDIGEARASLAEALDDPLFEKQ